MKLPALPENLSKKRIPTLIGLAVLVIGLVAGVIFIGQGPGIFAPRATPETTPSNIRITNITDNGFSVSFITDEATTGFVRYGSDPGEISSQAGDDRDQLSGTVAPYQTHHVSVRGLDQNKTYYFLLGTGSGAEFDNNGEPFSIRTTQRSGAPSAAKTVYGSVTNQNGGPGEGFIVYISLDGAGDMSSLVKSSGSWAIPLSNARTEDGSGYAQISDDDVINVTAQGLRANEAGSFSMTVAQAQPAPTISFAGGQPTIADASAIGGTESVGATELNPSPSPSPSESASPSPSPENEPPTESSASGRLQQLLGQLPEGATESTGSATINVDGGDGQIASTEQPNIIGTAAPNVVVTVEINSSHTITQVVTAGEDGGFVIDLAGISENLEPGNHTATVSYTDPTTGEDVTKTVAFTVESSDTSQQLAQANTGGTENEPFGSGNPFPNPSASVTPSPSPTPSPTPTPATSSAESTPSARTSIPATTSAIPESGSVGATLALILGGLFFMIAGSWSFWVSRQVTGGKIEV